MAAREPLAAFGAHPARWTREPDCGADVIAEGLRCCRVLSGCQTCGLLEKRNSVSETGAVLEDQQTLGTWFPCRAENKRVQFHQSKDISILYIGYAVPVQTSLG